MTWPIDPVAEDIPARRRGVVAGGAVAGSSGRRRIGVMGGTFDPIHHGHLVAASEVADRFGLDEVLFVPTGQPWQKSEVSPAEHRYLMAVIATAANPRFSVSRVDIDRAGPTYTKDTLTDLRRREPDAEWFFITGADALSAIMGWKDVDDLFHLAHFIGVTRPGYVLGDLPLPEGAVTMIEVPALAISSTDCRRRVAAGAPVWYLVPDGVVQYIGKYGLYAKPPVSASSGLVTAEFARAGFRPSDGSEEVVPNDAHGVVTIEGVQ